MRSPETPKPVWTSDDEFVLAGASYLCASLPMETSCDNRFRIIEPRRQLERYEQFINQANPKSRRLLLVEDWSCAYDVRRSTQIWPEGATPLSLLGLN